MANDRTLTAANSVLMIAVSGLFPVPQQLQGYETDDVYSSEAQETAELKAGVDGRLSGGWVYTPTPVEYVLQADSTSIDMFETWDAAEQASREKLVATGLVRLPSLGKEWALTRGFLTRVPRLGSAGKVLRSRRFAVTWENCSPASV